jgi:prepilin-type N-terminal cleavage/methylation domain-containing protein
VSKKTFTKEKAFTLVELLIVIVIISILAATAVVALDPVKRFRDARNSRRLQDVNTILTAFHSFIIDNNGVFPTNVNTVEKQIGTCSSGGATPCTGAASACLDMTTDMVKYLKPLPVDPSWTSAQTGYSIVVDTNNIVTVKACAAELTPISASR